VSGALKFEAGKSYRTRDGRKANVFQILDQSSYPVVGAIENDRHMNYWALDGRWSRFPDDSGSRDLIAEWVDTTRSNTLTDHSIMLGQIAVEVEEFCDEPHTTTLQAVLAMKAELYELRAKNIWDRINTKKKVDQS